jgi:hypothetical protein
MSESRSMVLKLREYQVSAVEFLKNALPKLRPANRAPYIPREGDLVITPRTNDNSHVLSIQPRQHGKSVSMNEMLKMLGYAAERRWRNKYRHASHRRKVEMLRESRTTSAINKNRFKENKNGR